METGARCLCTLPHARARHPLEVKGPWSTVGAAAKSDAAAAKTCVVGARGACVGDSPSMRGWDEDLSVKTPELHQGAVAAAGTLVEKPSSSADANSRLAVRHAEGVMGLFRGKTA